MTDCHIFDMFLYDKSTCSYYMYNILLYPDNIFAEVRLSYSIIGVVLIVSLLSDAYSVKMSINVSQLIFIYFSFLH